MLRNYGRATGFAQGLSEGLRNVATIRNIQKSVEDEDRADRQEIRQKTADERAKVVQGQQDTLFKQGQEKNARDLAEYNRLHDRTIDPETVIGGLGLDEEGQNYVRKVASPFMPQGGKLSITDLTTIRDNVMKDPKVVSEIQNHRRRALGKEISAMEEEVNALGSDQGGGLAQVGIYNQKKALLDQEKARMQELDPNWSKREELALKNRELGVHEKTVETQAQTAKDTAEFHKKTLEQQAAHQKAVEKQQAAQTEIERKKLEATMGAQLRDDQMKILSAVSPKAKRTVTDEAGNVTVIETPDLVKGMETARKLRPDLFKDVPIPPKDKIIWETVWPKLEQRLKDDPSKAADVAAKIKEEIPDMNGEMLAGPLFKDKPNLVKALKPYFPVAKAAEKATAPGATANPTTFYERPRGGLRAYGEEAKKRLEEKRIADEKAVKEQKKKNIERQNRRARMPWERE